MKGIIVTHWRMLVDQHIPFLLMLARNSMEERKWLVKVIEYVSVAAITTTIILYGSDLKKSSQIESIKENERQILQQEKELKDEIAQIRRDLYVPRSVANEEKIKDGKRKK
jgi:hypothetical protein